MHQEPISIFLDFSQLLPNFLMPSVQSFFRRSGSRKSQRSLPHSLQSHEAVFPITWVEYVPGVGRVEHW